MTSCLFRSAGCDLASLTCISIWSRAFPTVVSCTDGLISLKPSSKLVINLMLSKYAVLIYLTEALLHSLIHLHIVTAATWFLMRTSLLDACRYINVSSHVILYTKCIFFLVAHLGHDFYAVIQSNAPF